MRWSTKKCRSSPKISQFFWPTLGEVQKKTSSFLIKITASPFQLLLANPFGVGLFSFLKQKSASKALKPWYFKYFSGQKIKLRIGFSYDHKFFLIFSKIAKKKFVNAPIPKWISSITFLLIICCIFRYFCSTTFQVSLFYYAPPPRCATESQ